MILWSAPAACTDLVRYAASAHTRSSVGAIDDDGRRDRPARSALSLDSPAEFGRLLDGISGGERQRFRGVAAKVLA